jgi:hypothetical protein
MTSLINIEVVRVNLTVLAKVEKNQKLATRDRYLNIEVRSLVPEFVRRWRRDDNRDETLKQINQTVDNAILLSVNNNGNFDVCKYLKRSLYGINNLKQTYSSCTLTVSRFDVIIDKINKHLDSVNYDDNEFTDNVEI